MLRLDIVEAIGTRFGSIPMYVVHLVQAYKIGASEIARSFNSEAVQ